MNPQDYILLSLLAVCGVTIASYPIASIVSAAYFNQKLEYTKRLGEFLSKQPEVTDE